MGIDEVTLKILSSKKYRFLLPDFVRSCVAVSFKAGKGGRQAEQATRLLLHQVWGVYLKGKAKHDFLIKRLEDAVKVKGGESGVVLDILKSHASTAERLHIMESFYRGIFNKTGKPDSIIDIGCGLNPVAFRWMKLKLGCRYMALDVDLREIDFLNKVFRVFGASPEMQAGPYDILGDKALPELHGNSVIFLFKILPLIEQLQPGKSSQLMQLLRARSVVVSFPTRSLGGRGKGMIGFYRTWFTELMQGSDFKITEILFDGEMVFVCKSEK